MNYIIEGEGTLVYESGKEYSLIAGDFVLENPSGFTQGNRALRASSGAQRIIPMRNTSTGTREISHSR